MKPSTLKRFMRLPRFEDHLELHRIDSLASHGNLAVHAFLSQTLADTPASEMRPAPLVTGHDLIEMGHKPGPKFREILAALEDLQLEGKLKTRDEALQYVREQISY
jgi:poly(A) polymerase